MKTGYFPSTLLLLATFLAGCSDRASHPPEAPASFIKQGELITIPARSPLRNELKVEAVRQEAFSSSIAAPAVIEIDPRRSARIVPPYAGRVTRLNVQLGDRVEVGQLLAVMAAPEAGVASADMRRARAQLSVAATQRSRANALRAIGGIADKDIQQAESDYAVALAERDRANETVKVAGVASGGQVLLRSPIDGSVTELSTAPETLVGDTTTSIMTISDLATVWVNANVAESDVGRVRVGQAVVIRVAGSPQNVIDGSVAAIGDILDPETRRIKVRIIVPNRDRRLKPGMFATVEIKAIAVPAVTVPSAALLLRDDRTRVFVEVRPFVFRPRQVVTGESVGGRTMVVQGLRAGERVISTGGVYLND